jgi:hypothetical protein
MRLLLGLGLALGLAGPSLAADRDLTWPLVPGATSYAVYRCPIASGTCWRYADLRNWTWVVEIPAPPVRVSYGKPAFYAVAARYPTGAEVRQTAYGFWAR